MDHTDKEERKEHRAKLRALSRSLAQLSPQEALAQFFGKRSQLSGNQLILEARQSYGTRRAFLRWVYGNHAVIRNVTFERLPSLSKVRLVKAILQRVNGRFPWIRSRTLHALAMAPEYFDPRNRKNARGDALYQKRVLVSGGKRRTLNIPSRFLRYVQRAVLRLLQAGIAAARPQCVYGVGGPRSSIFDNALQHMGQQFVVSFDFKDFFDSIRVEDVIRGLCRLDSAMMIEFAAPKRKADDSLGVSAQPVKQWIASTDSRSDSDSRALPWTTDVAVLVARLCTHLGRLPQGAPTSPLLANVAFFSYDKMILNALGPEFVYTRYFDDLTISISRQAASKLRISNSADFVKRVRGLIEAVLRKTPFRFNCRKTRTSSLGGGHRITGLSVHRNRVTLGRQARREMRAVLHRIKTEGFVAAATRWTPQEFLSRTQSSGNVDELTRKHIRDDRRLSTEKLAALMLRAIDPQPSFEYPPGILRFTRDGSSSRVVKGREFWRMIEPLLSYVWTNEVKFSPVDDQSVEDGDGRRIRSTAAAYLLLGKREAIACAELWHYLAGWKAFAKGAPPDDAFGGFRDLETEVNAALRAIEFRALRAEATEKPRTKPLILTQSDRAANTAEQAFALIDQYTRRLDIDRPRAWVENAYTFQKPVDSIDELDRWIEAARALTIDGHDLLPADPRPATSSIAAKIQWTSDRIFELIRTKSDLYRGLRLPSYFIIIEFEHALKDKSPLGKQEEFLRALQLVFQGTLIVENRQPANEWKAALFPNEFRSGIPKRLEDAVDHLAKALREAVLHFGQLLARDAVTNLVSCHRAIARQVEENTRFGIYEALFKMGHDLFEAILEVPDEIRKRQRAWLKTLGSDAESTAAQLRRLRNRDAHPPGPEHRNDWLAIQGDLAKRLGREWWHWGEDRRKEAARSSTGMNDENDIQLTAFEASEAKLSYIKSLTAILRSPAP